MDRESGSFLNRDCQSKCLNREITLVFHSFHAQMGTLLKLRPLVGLSRVTYARKEQDGLRFPRRFCVAGTFQVKNAESLEQKPRNRSDVGGFCEPFVIPW